MLALKLKRRIAGCLCLLSMLAYAVSISLTPITVPLSGNPTYTGGWNSTGVSEMRLNDAVLLREIPEEWRGMGVGQVRLLYQDYAAVHGKTYEPRDQDGAPSCVGQAVAGAVDFLAAMEIHTLMQPERAPPGPAAACAIYGMSRVDIGGVSKKGGGSHNLWAVKAIQKFGVIARLNYPMLRADLREPSASRAIKYGYRGVPAGLKAIARIHPVKDYVAINSYEDLRDALAMGYPVVIGSKQGFGNGRLKRDSEGFLNPPRRVFRPSVWNHAMVCIGVADVGRKGALILNSWGPDWIYGPDRFPNTPKGCFFVDDYILDRMVKQGDSYAIRGYRGYTSYRIF